MNEDENEYPVGISVHDMTAWDRLYRRIASVVIYWPAVAYFKVRRAIRP